MGGTGTGFGYSGIDKSIAVVLDAANNQIILLKTDETGTTTFLNQLTKSMFTQGSTTTSSYTYHLWVDYNGSSLEFRVSTTNARPASPDLQHPINLSDILGTNIVYPGFTASTSDNINYLSTGYTINSMYLDNKYNPLDPSTTTY